MLLFFVALAVSRPELIPEPNSVEIGNGVWTLSADVVISYDPTVPGAVDVANWAGHRLRIPTAYNIPITNTSTQTGIRFLKAETQMAKEDYELRVTSESASIFASTSNGFWFGLVTLMQLLPPEVYSKHSVFGVAWEAPVCTIIDSPRFSWRGIMLDVSRHFVDVDGVKMILDAMSMLKMNVFHWHLTDDQGWRLEIKKYPNFVRNGSTCRCHPIPWEKEILDGVQYGPFYYTQDQVREIIKYAKTYGITIVPEIEMPGHAISALVGYPELSCGGVGPSETQCMFGIITEEALCPGNDRTLEVLQDVLDEVMELFESEYIHVGGDECVKTHWEKCDKCQKRIKDEGLAGVEQLQSWFIQKMANYIESKGRHLIGWDEILEGGLAQGAAVMSWRGTAGGAAAAAMGHNVVMTPHDHVYLDYNQFPVNDVFQYLCCLNPLYKMYAYEPLDGIPEEGHRFIIGVQSSMWTAWAWGGDYDVQYKTFPRSAAVAEVGWTAPEKKSWHRFLTSHIRAMRKRLRIADVYAAPVQPGPRTKWTPAMVSSTYTTHAWDVSEAVGQKGAYQCAFILTKGDDLSMKNVKLLFDDRVVALDNHEGVASWDETTTNFYSLQLNEDRATQKVLLQADIKSSADSYGEVVLYATGL